MSVQDLINVFSSGVFATALTGALAFLGRNWISERLKASIQHEYDQKLETHKAQLKSQTEAEIIRLKAQLEIAAAERNVRYSKVFEHTAEVIATTYAKLLALKDAADDYTQPLAPSDPNREEAAKRYQQKAAEFLHYFLPNKIYIPRETSERIRVLSNTLTRAALQFSMAMADAHSQSRDPETYGKLFNAFFKSSEEVPQLLELLEDEFRKLLGFQAENKPAP